MKIKHFFYRLIALMLAVMFFIFAPLGAYMDTRVGKMESKAFAIAIPAAITAYELVQYALIAIATSAGVYGIATADWDSIIWEFSHSYFGNTSSVETWAENMVYKEQLYYDDGSMRNILIDYAMADIVYYFSDAVGVLSPDYDLTDLPDFNPDDYDTIDNTAAIMEAYYKYLLELSEPAAEEQRMKEAEEVLREILEYLLINLDSAGAHIPTDEDIEADKNNKPHKGKAQNELNQAVCDYFNYIVHAFEANSTFYQPSPENKYNIHIVDALSSAWLAFLVSKGLVSETPDNTVTNGIPTTYERYDARTLYGIDNCVDITEFLFPDSKYETLYVYGLPWGYTVQTSTGFQSLSEPSESFVRGLNDYRVLSWHGSFSSYNSILDCCDTVLTFTWDGSKWRSGSYKSYQGIIGPGVSNIDFTGIYRTNYMTVTSNSLHCFSGNIKFIKDGVTYGLLDFLDKQTDTGYLAPDKSLQDVPVQETGGIIIYTPDIATDVPNLITKVDAVAQSPTMDLSDQKVQDLFGQVENIYSSSTVVDPDIPVNPDAPIVPDVPVDPVDPGGSDVSGNPDMDSMKTPVGITDKFPFCVPFDLIDCVKVWNVQPKKPVFEIPFEVKSLGIKEIIVVDLTVFDSVTSFLRFLILLSYIAFLVVLTRNIVKG